MRVLSYLHTGWSVSTWRMEHKTICSSKQVSFTHFTMKYFWQQAILSLQWIQYIFVLRWPYYTSMALMLVCLISMVSLSCQIYICINFTILCSWLLTTLIKNPLSEFWRPRHAAKVFEGKHQQTSSSSPSSLVHCARILGQTGITEKRIMKNEILQFQWKL